MAKDENSVERANRLIHEYSEMIESCRENEVNYRRDIEEIDSKIARLQQDRVNYICMLEDEEKDKLDYLCIKMALIQFVQNGGGLDMLVD